MGRLVQILLRDGRMQSVRRVARGFCALVDRAAKWGFMSTPRTIVRSSICAALLVGLFAAPAFSRSTSESDASPGVIQAPSPNASKDEASASQPTAREPFVLTAFDLVHAARKVYCKDSACGPAPRSDGPRVFTDTAASAEFDAPDVIRLQRRVSGNVDIGLICPPSLITATVHW